MLRYLLIGWVLFTVLFAAPTDERLVRPGREVGGSITRNFPGLKDLEEREVGGVVSRKFSNLGDGRIDDRNVDDDEIWTLVQTDEENLVMDNVRGKDVPLSLTEDFRGMEPVLPLPRSDYIGIVD